MVQRAKKHAKWKECNRWFESVFKPHGYITIEIGFTKREEEVLRIVQAYFAKVARISNQHLLGEVFWDKQPNSVNKKMHCHIFYRFEKTIIEPVLMEAHWKCKIADILWKSSNSIKERSIDAFALELATAYPDIFRSVVADNDIDNGYWAKAHKYKLTDDESNKGTLFRYTYAKHGQSKVVVGCPKRHTKCRQGKCKHHKHKENYWKDI